MPQQRSSGTPSQQGPAPDPTFKRHGPEPPENDSGPAEPFGGINRDGNAEETPPNRDGNPVALGSPKDKSRHE